MEELNNALTKNWKILHNVSSSKLLKLGALTYFKSKPGHDAFKSMSSKLLTEFCQVAFDLINNDDKELSLETRKTLFDLINDETIGELTLYKVGLVINRKKRLKFFTFMENMDTNLWLKFSQNDNKLITFLNDCMQSVNINTMKWLSPQSCTNNINILIEAELNHLKNETDIECQLVFKSMQLLNKLYENTLKNPKIDINKYHTFLFDRIIILVYMGYKQQRKVSLELLTIALKTNFLTHIQDNLQKLWQQYKDNLSKIYCNRMNLLVLSNDYDWATQWSLSIQMLGIDLHRGGAGLINPLLGVEEKAYKSSDNKIRKQAFLCWKVLMDNFSLNPSELSSQRRIKLLCIPLIAKNSKIESLALVKLETWWHLIIKLQPIDTQYLQQVINSFLEFCFGPLGDTPLLSTQIDNNGIIASSAKRFYKTRVLAVDALLQLLIRRKDDRKLITLSLKERLPDAITNIIFKSIYKKLLHSVGEALLLITNLNDDDIKNRDTLCNILWSNLVEYIEESPDDERIEILKELIVVINGLTNHINDSIIISNLIINTIIPEIADLRYTKLITNDDTLIILTKKLLNPTVLKKIEVRHLISIKTLMSCGLKSININTNIKIFDFIDSILAVIENDSYDNFHSIIIEVWCIFASIIIKYINEDNDINEGNDIKHNFKTLFKLIHFPFVCPFWRDITPGPQQAKMISTLWIKLYKLFDMKAHAILTVKPNEILDTLTNTIYKYCSKEKKCYRFVAYCLETIISTIDYKVLFSNNNVPSIIHILRDTTKETLNGPEGELSLKALSLVLMSIYSLADYNKTLSYLEAVKSTIEYMLKIELCHGNIEKEIINTWDTVVIIIKGHSKYLTNNFIEVYHDTFLAAYCHKGVEIVANIMSLKESIDLKPNIKNALLNIEKEAQKIISNQNLLIDNDKKQLTYINNNNNNNNSIKLQKPIKIVGSFLGREGIVNTKLPTTITKIVTVNKDNELKKIIPVNNDSQDYVVINNNNNNNINIDVDFLTEHQKETFKKRRDDIPALYNDLSQSMSHDTQDLKEWFDENRKKAAEKDNNDYDNNKKQDTIVIDEQNESKIINLQTSFDDEKSINVNNEDKLITSTSTTTTTTTTTTVLNSINDEVTIKPNDSTSIEENTSDNLSDSIAKKLDFESREEYPDDNEHIDNKQTDVTLKKSDRLLTRGRGRGRSIKPREPTDIENKNLKRKASSDNESDNPTEIKKRKRTSPESSLTSDTFVTSDSDSNHSIDNENQSSSGQETIIKSDKKNLPDQTKRELLRLRINMVSDSYLPGRRRSKLNDETDNKNNKKDTIDNKQNKVRSNKNDKQDKDEESQELTKYRRKRTSKINTSFIKQEETSSPGKRKKNNNDNKEQDKLNCSFEDMSDKSSNVDPNEEQTGEITNNEKTSTTKNQSINKSDNSDHDEVVESSQDKLPTRSPRSIGKNVSRLNSPSTRSSSVPITSTPITNKTTPLINQNDQSTISNSTTKKSPEKSKQTTAPAITTSPKSSKILIKKRPTLPPPSQRRTYQIMDLLKGMNYINNEDLQSDEFTNVSEFVNNKKNKSIETFISPSATKKDRNINLNTPDKINSPSGSRQEKIFNNMKISEIKNTESSVLFSNLKNNGEKISPKLDKTNKLNDDSEFIEIDNNTSTQNDELEFLEWSDANPPSLTASPSASILKRQKSLIETSTKNDRDTSFNKKKRVSFTEPPVSKKMGYLVTSTLKTFPIAKNLLNKKDTSLKIRSLKLKTIQINNTNKTDEISKIKKINDSPIENLTDIAINSQNEYLNKIEDDLENTADINVDIDADETPDDLPVSNNELDTSIKTPSSNNTDILDNEKNINTKEKPKDTLASSFDLSCHDSLTGKFKQSMDLFDPNYDLTNKNKINASDLKTSTPSLIKNSISNRSSIDATDDIAVGKMLHERVLKKGLQVSSSSPLPSTSTSTSNSSQLTNDINTDKTSKINTVITTIPATPVTDTSSINESITSSQINKTNNSQSQNKILIKTPPIFPNLINCQEPISKIIDDIPTSLWRNPFLKYLTVENIMTVGDLAKKTEFEIFNIPKIKGQKTIGYVKQALDDFYTIYINEQNLINNKLQIDETNQSQSVNDIIIENVESIIEPITQDIIEQSSDIITSNDTIDNSISIKNSQLHIDSQSSGDYESMIIDSSIETPKLVVKNINELTKLPKVKVIDTLSPTSQLKHSTLQPLIFKELDLDVIVQHVVKKCSLEQIFGHLKNKMNNMTEEEKLNNIAKLVDNNETNNKKFNNLLQINNLHDGLVKIQNLFSTEKNFIQQVLTTYKNQITSDVCKQSIDDNILKEAICKSCTSSELIKLLTTVLNNEKNNGITVPVNDDLSIDLITKIIDNDKLTNTDTVVNKIQENSPNVSIKLFNNIVPETINDTLTNSNMSEDELLTIFKTVSSKLSTDTLLAGFTDVVKQKMK